MVLFGCGGHSRSVISSFRESSDEQIILVDEKACTNEIILGCKAVTTYNLSEDDKLFIAIGDNSKRRKIYEFLSDEQKEQLIIICSQTAIIREAVSIGKGTFVSGNVYIGPEVSIGKNTIINSAATIEHEVTIGSHSHIAPNTTICGRSKIGNDVFCGASSTIIDNIQICDFVVIGAGAVVTKDITEPGIYVGIPAKRIK